MLEFTFNARACDERTCQPPTGVRQVQISTHAPCIGSSSPARAVIVNLDALSFADIATQRPAFDVVSGAPITRAFANRMYHNSTARAAQTHLHAPHAIAAPKAQHLRNTRVPQTRTQTQTETETRTQTQYTRARAARPHARPHACTCHTHAGTARTRTWGTRLAPTRACTRARAEHISGTHISNTQNPAQAHTRPQHRGATGEERHQS